MKLQPGTLDTAFANAGVLEWAFPEFASISPEAVVPLPDGRLLVVASDPAYPQGFIVARLTEAGRLDVGTGFGDREQGFVQIAIPDKSLRWNASASLLGDGRLLVTYDYSGLTTGERGYVVMLLLSDGCLDEGFGEGGVVAFPFGSLPATLERTGKAAYADVSAGEAVESVTHGGGLLGRSVIALPDGKIAVVSFGFDLNTQQTKGLVMRLNSDGSFDETFNKTGKASVELGDTGNNAARGVEAHTDGGLVVYGDFNEGGTLGIYVVRFKEDGTRDEQFSTVMLSSEKMPYFYDIAVRKKDGIIALAGGQYGEGEFDGVGVIVVLKGDGSYHPVFNNGKPLFQKVLPEIGQQWTTCAFGGKDENTLIMSGTSGGTWLLDDTRAVLARYLLTGDLDTSFNGQGWVVFDQPDRLEVARDLTITAQDRIVVCGDFHKDRQAFNPNGGWIARYLA